MGTLDNVKGWINDGTGNLVVQGTTTHVGPTVVGSMYMTSVVLPGSASFGQVGVGVNGGISGSTTIPSPGFYSVPVSGSNGVSGFTCSLPSAAAFPGGDILITDTAGQFPYLITGSMAVNVAGAGGIQTLSSSVGTKLTVPAGGTVGFWSDSKGWLLCAVSGSVTLKA